MERERAPTQRPLIRRSLNLFRSSESRLQENLRGDVLLLLEKIREVCDRQFSFKEVLSRETLEEFENFKRSIERFNGELGGFKNKIEAALQDVGGKLDNFTANRERFFVVLEARVNWEIEQAKAQLDEKKNWQDRYAQENATRLVEFEKADSAVGSQKLEEYATSLNYQAMVSKSFEDAIVKNLRAFHFFNSVREGYSADPESLGKFLEDVKVILESNLTAIRLVEEFIKKHFSYDIEKLFNLDNDEVIIEEREALKLMGSFFTDFQKLIRALSENKPSVNFDVGQYNEFEEEMRAAGGEDFLLMPSDLNGKKITDLFFKSPNFFIEFPYFVKKFVSLGLLLGCYSFRGIDFCDSSYKIVDGNFYKFNFEPKNTEGAEEAEEGVDLSEYSISTQDVMETVQNLLAYAKVLLEKQNKDQWPIKDLLFLKTFEPEFACTIKYIRCEGYFLLFSKIFELIVAITGVPEFKEKEMVTAFKEGLYELARQGLVNNPDAVQTLAINIISGLDVNGELLKK